MKSVRAIAAVAAVLAMTALAETVDRIVLGNEASEAAHGFADGGTSRVDAGTAGRPCRRILKPDGERWRAGPMRFRLKVARGARTYLRVVLWGGDVSHDHMFCTIDGKMLGQMHLGEYDLLDYESCWPRDAERTTSDAEHFGVFTTRTFLVPEELTAGRDSVEVAIYAAGHVWGYGVDFEQFQKMVEHDSRGIYAVATMDAAGPAEGARMNGGDGPPLADASAACAELASLILSLQEKIDRHLRYLMEPGILAKRRDEAGFLAEAYSTPWCVAYRNPAAVEAVVAATDAEIENERAQPGSIIGNGTWYAGGRMAIAAERLGAEVLRPYMTDERRRAWRAHFLASVEYLMAHRRFFANQSQIVDTNAHWCNRALKACDPSAGPPLAETLERVKEAMGLKPMPNGYVALTAKGLSKEDGYVGSYGESTIWAAANACEASEGDAELLAQLRKASRARLYMRYPGVRRDGRRVARLEAQVSWRNEHFPPPPTYLTSGLDIRNAILARDPALVGAVRDALLDGTLADYVRAAKDSDIAALRFPEDWRKVRKVIERSGGNLPHMPCFSGDFVWGDPENAVVAVRHGSEMLFVEAYWRARGGVNNLAKVHFVSPRGEDVATVFCNETYEKQGGRVQKIGDWFQYGWMGRLYPGYCETFAPDEGVWPPRNATAGALRPVAANGGRADFYVVRYGPYLVAINDSHCGKRHSLAIPAGEWHVLPEGCRVPGGELGVEPHSCVVLRLVKKREGL